MTEYDLLKCRRDPGISLNRHLKSSEFGWIAMKSVLELDGYLNKEKLDSNNFAHLREILKSTLNPLPSVDGKREIDNIYLAGQYLKEVFEEHKKNTEGKTPYLIEENITQETELTKNLVRLISQTTQDLEDLSKLSKEKLKSLKQLCLDFSNCSPRYVGGFRRSFAA